MDFISSNDEHEDENHPSREPSNSSSPKPLKAASAEIDVTLNGKSSSTLDRSNVDLNQSFEEFIDRLNDILSKKTKLSKDIIMRATKTSRWIWMTLAKSQFKNLPRFNDLETEEHYQQLQKDVRTTSRKNSDLDNMILRIHVEIRLNSDDGDTTAVENDESSNAERSVSLIIQ